MSQAPSTKSEESEVLDRQSAYRVRTDEINQRMLAGRSLSGHERNCAFLNVGDGKFVTASGVSGFDMPDDSRSIALCDWDRDGRTDAWTSARTAPQLRFLHNELENAGASVSIRLQGAGPVNRDAIGSRVELSSDSQKPLVQTLRAGEGFLSQSEKILHFGLGSDPSIAPEASVIWPDGKRVQLGPLKANTRYELRYPDQIVALDQQIPTLSWNTAGALPAQPFTSAGTMRLIYPVPLPDIKLTAPGNLTHVLGPPKPKRFHLLNLWNPACAGCIEEIEDFTTHADELKKAGIKVIVALGPGASEMQEATKTYDALHAPFSFGQLSVQDTEFLDSIIDTTLGISRDLVLPTSLLIGPGGTLQAIYLGAIPVQTLLNDVSALNNANTVTSERAALLSNHQGQWQSLQEKVSMMFVPLELMKQGRLEDADIFIRRHSTLLSNHKEYGRILIWIGDEYNKRGKSDQAMVFYLNALQNDTTDPLVMNNVAWQLATNANPKARNGADAVKWAEKAVQLTQGHNPSYLDTLAAAYAETGDFKRALTTVDQAHALAKAQGASALLPGLEKARQLYRAGRPYRD